MNPATLTKEEDRDTSIPERLPLDEHNEAIRRQVHPMDWVNPLPRRRDDLVVIGVGTGGHAAAAGAAGPGARVALIERRLMGGDCLNVGCVATKAEATFHLTGPLVYPCIVVIAFLMFPAVALELGPFTPGAASAAFFGLLILLLPTASAGAFYAAGQLRRGASPWRTIMSLPAVIALGAGMSVNNTRAVTEAGNGHQSPFVRTPKCRRDGIGPPRPTRRPRPHGIAGLTALVIAGDLVTCAVPALTLNMALRTLPFLTLFATGYLRVGLGRRHSSGWRDRDCGLSCRRRILRAATDTWRMIRYRFMLSGPHLNGPPFLNEECRPCACV